MILAHIGVVLPRDPFEAASSLAASLLGHPAYIRRGGIAREAELAYGTVTVALESLANCTSGFFGTADDLLSQRTLVNYCAFQMTPRMREAFRQRVQTGIGAMRLSGRAPWMIATYPDDLSCPLCEQEAWNEFGTRATFWPHRAPMVRACWRHELQLVPSLRGPEPCYAADCLREASAAQMQFAQDTVMVCQLGANCEQAAVEFQAQIAAAGVLRANGIYATAQFSQSFSRFCMTQIDDPALHGLFNHPRLGRWVLRWVRSGGDAFIAPMLLVLLLGWLRVAAQSTAIMPLPPPPSPQRGRTMKRRVKGWAGRFSGARLAAEGRRRYGKSDIERLLRSHCTYAQIAALCRISESTVSRYVSTHGLKPLAIAARIEQRRPDVRRAWQLACHHCPDRSCNAIRALEPRAYRWLITHDRAWLRQQCQAFERAKGWRRRLLPTPGCAATIAEQVRKAHRALSSGRRKTRCTRSALCRALGVTPYLFDRWRKASPLIAKAIKDVLE
ncbi:TnsD family Tn7-like transposition protein [Cupriavidus taiwanensis]|uniref:TnsD family Tn7-like transposition protein n=1 Tax=Cupriavidus taiwanensis TaxID=164546 RepID=UPI000E1AE689|nr:TnsD family Tn7-like transposition protein [Cupriavidus taiwanensis]SPC18357.1 hypothetical protein CT19431_MP30299 [Cupriavidus taiwanensis]